MPIKPIDLARQLSDTGSLSETAKAELLDDAADYLREVAGFLQEVDSEYGLPIWINARARRLMDGED